MNKTVSIIIDIVTLLLLVACLLLYCSKNTPPTVMEKVVVTADTIVIRDTVTIERLIPTIVRVKDTIIVHTTDTLMRDVVVSLPREERVYEDSTFRAVVSGYQPSLDDMQIYQKQSVVKVTELIQPPQWSIGIQGGVGVTPKGVQPYIGVGVSYRLDIIK